MDKENVNQKEGKIIFLGNTYKKISNKDDFIFLTGYGKLKKIKDDIE